MSKPNSKKKDTPKKTPPELSKAEQEKLDKQKVRREKDRAKAVKTKAAKAALRLFLTTAVCEKLPEGIADAIKLLTSKAERTRGANWLELFNDIFPEVGASISELDLFLKTKMGRGEFRRKVQYAMKKTEPENRFWVSFDEAKETWTLEGTGADAPEGFQE